MTQKIDWVEYERRVPIPVQVKWEFGWEGNWNYGILLETRPFRDYERVHMNAPKEDAELYTHVRVQCLPGINNQRVPLNKRPTQLVYLINGQWRTFDEVMA
jgi:hypothetical protein